MSDDLIKRSDALSAAGDMSYIAFEIRRKIRMIPSADTPYKVLAHVDLDPDEVANRMKHLQIEVNPVNPAEGKWEEKETFCVTDDDPIISQWQSARCSECGKYHTTPYMYYFNDYNYCPNCGAKMVNDEGGK